MKNDRVIWKFPLDICREQEVPLHRVHEILTVQAQGNVPMLWAMVNPATKPENVTIFCYGTGHEGVDPDAKYIATVQIEGFVWHFYEWREVPDDQR